MLSYFSARQNAFLLVGKRLVCLGYLVLNIFEGGTHICGLFRHSVRNTEIVGEQRREYIADAAQQPGNRREDTFHKANRELSAYFDESGQVGKQRHQRVKKHIDSSRQQVGQAFSDSPHKLGGKPYTSLCNAWQRFAEARYGIFQGLLQVGGNIFCVAPQAGGKSVYGIGAYVDEVA